MAKNIILVGPMGAGKTTIGRQLAKTLAFQFKDVDQLIVEQAGADIPWIFDVEGESGFRHREANALKNEVALDQVVVATGGGIIKRKTNRTLLKGSNFVVYLYADVETQYQRTLKDKNRPLLQGCDPKQKLAMLMQQRAPLYEEVASITVETHKKSLSTIVDDILKHWHKLA